MDLTCVELDAILQESSLLDVRHPLHSVVQARVDPEVGRYDVEDYVDEDGEDN